MIDGRCPEGLVSRCCIVRMPGLRLPNERARFKLSAQGTPCRWGSVHSKLGGKPGKAAGGSFYTLIHPPPTSFSPVCLSVCCLPVCHAHVIHARSD